ncbi:glycosyltransferase [Flavobacterium macrobrachii]|uniref:Glycosyltransferase n=2 Tax=Flavobacterium macrobrachii TaxID=591204 RepID=A0ABS2CXX9_9FLAO|nr:glycosyltransferase [Flavobacterium macrobrachii]
MYKVADHVTRCIESLQNQDIDKNQYEIICINDGSPDNCQEVVENLQKKYSNIVLINQVNQGVSMARNNGIDIAKAKYILPIDPDDYVVPNSLGRIASLVQTNNYQVFYLGFEIFDANQKSIWKTNYTKQENKTFNGVEGYFEARGFEVKDPDRSWAIVYDRQLLNDYKIDYPKNVPYLEDGLFLAKVFAVATSVGFDNQIFYQRTTRKGSATNSKLFFSEKAINGFILAINDIKNFAANNNLVRTQQQLVNHVVAKFVLLPMSPFINKLDFFGYLKIIRLLKSNGVNKIEADGVRQPYKKLSFSFNFNKVWFFINYIYFIKFSKS